MSPDAFFALTEALCAGLSGTEILFCQLGGESSDFARLSQNRIRQAGHLQSATLGLSLLNGHRQAEAFCDLGGVPEQDLRTATGLLERLRERIPFVPEDPYLNYSMQARESLEQVGEGLPPAEAVMDLLVAEADGLDLVGIWASGSVCAGLGSSVGHRFWHESRSFNLDWSSYLQTDKALKCGYGGFRWEPDVLRAKVGDLRRGLEVMARPARVIQPGRYRAYLAPAALQELLALLAWGGFGLKDHRTHQSPLLKLVRAERGLAAGVNIQEEHVRGLMPRFTAEGFLKPDRVTLIEDGAFRDCLVDARTAREYGAEVNAAADVPESIAVGAGDLAMPDVLARLDTGLSIGNLWYCNWSDMNDCRMTGMTRFGTFWVEGGELVAPVEVMRFDDSLYHLLGERLEALTRERELILSPETYEGRSNASALLPGLLVSGIDLAL
ncbi:metallopeptidase TldD-related protein [Thiocystis violacea]|uniref:metallopeptidase TldD-related protein n=1 Tax=Thiocystis violacea TaxID=13725 RepID=UPI001903EDAD|nr:metallopeptidase TldD-related protein [Thiocystis violacea]MBK1725099.1 peptidase [Thiocystis violacea]